MSTVLEITQLSNGDVVLRDADEEGEALVRIRFSDEVKDMLGGDLVGVAEAMIDAATDFLEGEPPGSLDGSLDGLEDDLEDDTPAQPRVVH
jgi:hypothetical protein